MTRQKLRREAFECPNCGADVPVGRKACPECGSDDRTGWQGAEEIEYQGLDLPPGYSVDPEHPGNVIERRKLSPWLIAVVVLTVLAFGLWAIWR